MSAEDLPEPDRVPGAPHPRHAPALWGQERAERDFLAALAGGRLHHGWLITGPRGVGKATLAWRIARVLLAGAEGGAASLDLDPGHPVARRVAALSEPRLKLIRRGPDETGERLKTVITVDEMRALARFFALTAAEGGRRVVIVDAADEMNANAANALLKLLEEPPAGAVLLLVCHRPAALLPTVRSRCRELRCAPLGAGDLGRALSAAGLAVPAAGPELDALALLADGSAGRAAELAAAGGPALYAELVGLLATLPRLDRARALAFAEGVGGRAEGRFELVLGLIETFLARLARGGVAGPPPTEAAPGEAALIARLAPDAAAARRWAAALQTLADRARRGRSVNLDPAALLLDMLLGLNAAAAQGAPE